MLTFLKFGTTLKCRSWKLTPFYKASFTHLSVFFGSSPLHLLFCIPVLHISRDCWVDCQDSIYISWLGAIEQETSKILLYYFSCCYICTGMRLHLSVPLSFTQLVPFKNVSRTFLNSSHGIKSDRINNFEEECHYLQNSASREGILHKAKQRESLEVSLQSFSTWCYYTK